MPSKLAPAMRKQTAGPIGFGPEMGLRVRYPHCVGLAFTVISSGIAPEASSVMDGSALRIAWANSLCLQNVILQSGMAELPRSIGLVADIPELDVVGLGMPVVVRACAPMRVFTEPFMYSTSSAAECASPKPAFTRDVRVHTDQLAQCHEFVHAHIIGLHGVPRIVKYRRTLVDVADGVVPVPVREEIAAWQPPHPRVELAQQRDRVWPESLHIVSRHQRNRADMEVAAALFP